MKIRTEGQSPKLEPVITEENYKRAVEASSGACLVADAITEQYPQFTHVAVDVATIRVTDKARGERYIYLTPAGIAEMLLAFDQGWTEEKLPKKLLIRKAVKIIPVTRSASMVKKMGERQNQRLLELETKEQGGEELTDGEQRALGKLRKPKKEPVDRPTSVGEAKVEVVAGKDIVVRGGVPIKKHKENPNLLHGRNRHFGAKSAQPSEVFRKAVKEAVKADRKKRKKKTDV